MTIEIPDKWLGEEIGGSMERILSKENKTKEQENIPRAAVISSGGFWSIEGVQYMDEIYRVDLFKTLLDGGSVKTQDEWAEYSRQSRRQGGFYTPDMPLVHGIFKAFFWANSLREQEIKEAKSFIVDTARGYWLTTLTRVMYQPNGLDAVVHGYNQYDQRVITGDLIGQSKKVTNVDKRVLQMVLENDNVQEIDKIYSWINGTTPQLWILDEKPKNLEERPAKFYMTRDWNLFNCCVFPNDYSISLGVRAVRSTGAQNSRGKP